MIIDFVICIKINIRKLKEHIESCYMFYGIPDEYEWIQPNNKKRKQNGNNIKNTNKNHEQYLVGNSNQTPLKFNF